MFKKRKIPHTYAIIFYIIILAAILTWILPGGEYVEKITIENGIEETELVFTDVDSNPQTWQVFSALFKGFERQAGIIVFILMIGGAFWIMNSTKAIDVGILSFIRFTKRLEHYTVLRVLGVDNLIISLVMVMFSIFGAVFGMSEETIAFIIILVPLAITMGYDSIVGVSMCFVAAGLGFAGAVLNPFTIGIAQGIAELPLFSGFEYRIFCWIIINLVGIGYILWYAKRIKKVPSRSPVFEEDQYWRERGTEELESIEFHTPLSAWISYILILISLVFFSLYYPMTELKIGNASVTFPAVPVVTGLFVITGIWSLLKSVHFYILSLLLYTILFLIIGVMGYGWYIMKIATLFFAMGIASGVAMG